METNKTFTKGYQKAIKDILDYISKRGFRQSNYEMDEVIKWLKKAQITTSRPEPPQI